MAIGIIDASKGISVTLPANKICSWTLGSQTAGTWTVTIKDASTGVVLLNQSQGGATLNPKCGTFRTTNSTNYIVTIAPYNRVLCSEAYNNLGEKIYAGTLVFVGEDGSDADFNDVYFALTWFDRAG